MKNSSQKKKKKVFFFFLKCQKVTFLMNDEFDDFENYKKSCEDFSNLVTTSIQEICYKKEIEPTIDAYKERFSEVNAIAQHKRQEVSERRDIILSKWNELTHEYSEERVKDSIDIQYQPQGINKMIQRVDEAIADTKNYIESFLYGYSKAYNAFVQTILNEYQEINNQIQPQIDGFGQRRKVLNDSKRKMNEYRQKFEELERKYNDVRRAGTYKTAKKTPDEIKAIHKQIIDSIDEKIAILDNDIKLALNLKLTEQRFTELHRIFNRADANHSGALELEELTTVLNTPRKRMNQTEIMCLLSNYGDGNSLNQFQFLQMMAERDIAARSGKIEKRPTKVQKGRFFTKGLLHI